MAGVLGCIATMSHLQRYQYQRMVSGIRQTLNPETGKQIPRTYKLEEGAGYDGIVHSESEADSKMSNAILKSYQWGRQIPIGIFYQNEMIPTYEEKIALKIPDYTKNPPSKQRVSLLGEDPHSDISNLLDILRVDNSLFRSESLSKRKS